MASNDLPRLLLPAFLENHSITFYFKEIVLDHLTEDGVRFNVLGRLKKVVQIGHTFFPQRPDEFKKLINPLLLHAINHSPHSSMRPLFPFDLSIHGFAFLFRRDLNKSTMADCS